LQPDNRCSRPNGSVSKFDAFFQEDLLGPYVKITAIFVAFLVDDVSNPADPVI
jgi:hypothetical protein